MQKIFQMLNITGTRNFLLSNGTRSMFQFAIHANPPRCGVGAAKEAQSPQIDHDGIRRDRLQRLINMLLLPQTDYVKP